MNNFYEFKNYTESSADLYIYGDIINDEEDRWYESDVTVKGFKEILEGKWDHLPEQAFHNVGTIEEAVKKAEAMSNE